MNMDKKARLMTKQCNHKTWKQQTALGQEKFVETQLQTSFTTGDKVQEPILQNGLKDLSFKVPSMALQPMQYLLLYP